LIVDGCVDVLMTNFFRLFFTVHHVELQPLCRDRTGYLNSGLDFSFFSPFFPRGSSPVSPLINSMLYQLVLISWRVCWWHCVDVLMIVFMCSCVDVLMCWCVDNYVGV
jgi:hypothetical protein